MICHKDVLHIKYICIYIFFLKIASSFISDIYLQRLIVGIIIYWAESIN